MPWCSLQPSLLAYPCISSRTSQLLILFIVFSNFSIFQPDQPTNLLTSLLLLGYNTQLFFVDHHADCRPNDTSIPLNVRYLKCCYTSTAIVDHQFTILNQLTIN